MIDFAKIVETAETIETDEFSVGGAEGYTPYQVAVELNKVLAKLDASKDDGTEYRITPQMLYTYAKQGRIDGHKYGKGEKARFDEETVENFIARYVASVLKRSDVTTSYTK